MFWALWPVFLIVVYAIVRLALEAVLPSTVAACTGTLAESYDVRLHPAVAPAVGITIAAAFAILARSRVRWRDLSVRRKIMRGADALVLAVVSTVLVVLVVGFGTWFGCIG